MAHGSNTSDPSTIGGWFWFPPIGRIAEAPCSTVALVFARYQRWERPEYVGETGMETSPTLSVAQRAGALRTRLTAGFQAGVVGSLIWDWLFGS
jgi:hypothetical protein